MIGKVGVAGGADAGLTWTYAYDPGNELISATETNSQGQTLVQESFTYDVFGNILATSLSTNGGSPVVTHYVYNDSTLWATTDASNGPEDFYLTGDQADQYFAQYDATNGAAWYLTNNLGSICTTMDNSGAAIDNIIYDAWGNITSQSNPSQQPLPGFTGLITIAALGVDAADVRIYDPQSGQWMQQDPLLTQAGPNTREYVNDNPTSLTDPTGKAPKDVIDQDGFSRAMSFLYDRIGDPYDYDNPDNYDDYFLDDEVHQQIIQEIVEQTGVSKEDADIALSTYYAEQMPPTPPTSAAKVSNSSPLRKGRSEFGREETLGGPAPRPAAVPAKKTPTAPQGSFGSGVVKGAVELPAEFIDVFQALYAGAYMDITGKAYIPNYFSQLAQAGDQASVQGGHAAVGDLMAQSYTNLALLGLPSVADAAEAALDGNLEPAGQIVGAYVSGKVMGKLTSPVKSPRFGMMPEYALGRGGARGALPIVPPRTPKSVPEVPAGKTAAAELNVPRPAGAAGAAAVEVAAAERNLAPTYEGPSRAPAAAAELAEQPLATAYDAAGPQVAAAEETAARQAGRVPLYSDGGPCFLPGTPMRTPDGEKVIELFRPGDWILSRSEYDVDGPVEAKVVEEVFERTARVMSLDFGGRTIWTTAEHPFYVLGKGWRRAKELRAGDWLVSLEGVPVVLKQVGETGEATTVYNLRVADYHTYFVGSREWGFSVWAHNTCAGILDTGVAGPDRYILVNARRKPIFHAGKPITGATLEEASAKAVKLTGISIDDLSTGTLELMKKIRASNASSERLGKNMEAAGRPKPSDSHQASHLVPGEDFVSRLSVTQIIQDARKILADAGIDIDDARNGFWGINSEGGGQNGTHSNAFFTALGEEMERARAQGGTEAAVEQALERLRTRVEKGEFLNKRVADLKNQPKK
jgi:RHS repeat-associated protein